MEKLTKEQIENLPEWMMIPDYPNYEVNCRKGLVRNANTLKVLKPRPNRGGYPIVSQYKDGKLYTKTVHRIIAVTAFHHYGISTDGLLVMHLDEERFDARISNLALGTNKENLNFPKAKQRQSERKGEHRSEATRMKIAEAKRGKPNIKLSKRVAAYKNGVLTLIFNSFTKVNVYGFCASSVCLCCRGRQKRHKGYEWRYF